MQRTIETLSEHLDYYIKKDPNDKYAVLRGVMSANKWRFTQNMIVRTVITIPTFIQPLLIVYFINWLQDGKKDTMESIAMACMAPLLIIVIKLVNHIVWEQFCFYLIEAGHLICWSLKNILLAKNFRMSSATNKDFDSAEIESIIMNDSNCVWEFIWRLPELMQIPFELICASYLTFSYIGWYGTIVFATTFLKFLLTYV